ncbi:MAG: chitobiase/beta-hexosaminidase C-terminal domain-containing protein, partial [Candidatus Promineifilaceae bacterium]
MLRRPSPLLLALFLIALLPLSAVSRTLGQTPQLTINEILPGNAAANLDPDFYEYASWIEIYNNGASAVDLQDYSLSYMDYGAEAAVIWKVPNTLSIPAQGHVLFWADETDKRGTHTSFELDLRGSEIALLDPAGNVLDSVSYDMRDGKDLLPDISYGRQPDGGGDWLYFDQPTPAAANTTPGFAAPTLAGAPTFSPPGGFYTGEQIVTLSTSESTAVIRYTTDGSIPTPSSPLYTDPLTLSGPTVIRARVFAPGKLAGRTASHTYLIDFSTTLPVISLATKPAHLFDDTIGIYVEGTNGVTGNCSDVPVNWNRSWERPVSMEMFETDGRRVVAQDAGLEIFGGCSRTFPRKSLEIKARRTYGDKDIDYQALPDKPIDSYKRLVLRNSGNDNYATQFRDALQQYLVKDMMDIDYQAYRPVVVFLNGAYWGLYNLRDKADEAFVEQNYDLDADS